ncbi:hypothetical protein HELRODRAFT_158635 [Helobdella robusta]|uniref:Uncharacterized protein n=1 Tax=Helobdella robusta TaxID=6412 RepID=T1EN20_HELRO|nr:hypothetical protein HELRODRAFT_158635 [Helobdella robusta]ESO12172.1 hypothetical protein HELRODRAFT_158635 [Helobdella robusta]
MSSTKHQTSIPVESFESILAKILDKSNDHTMKCFDNLLKKSNENLEKVITLSNNSLEKIFEKFDSSLTLVIEKSNENLRKSLANSEGLMSKLFESTLLRMEALSNSFERAVKSIVSECQKQVLKLNETPMIEQMTKALWIVERERKDEERRANNVIISGLVEQSGINDRDILKTMCYLVRTIGSRILHSKPDTRNIFINFDLSKRQAEQAYIKRQARRLAKSAGHKSKEEETDKEQPFR